MAKSKIFDFLNDLTSKGNPREDTNTADIGNNLKISTHRAHQKLLSYEIEILEGHLKREYQHLGEIVCNLFQQGKKVGKTTKELKSIFKLIDEYKAKLNQKINDKSLSFSFLDKPTTKTVEVKNKVKSKLNKPKHNKRKPSKATIKKTKVSKSMLKKTVKK